MATRNDGQLLSDVVSDGSEGAFEELVRRHGSLVLNQALRLLTDRQDAEDVTQAVFLVLWAKARSLRNRRSVAAWLHRTTRNVCRNAQRSKQVRRIKERRVVETTTPYSNELAEWNELKLVLDDELDRLPEKYRLPLILFHLEGLQLHEIAELTNSSRSTIGTRLRRGREMLRQRILRRGVTIETASLLAAIGIHAGAADVSASFAAATAHSANLFTAGQILPPALISPQSVLLAKGTLHMLAIKNLTMGVAAVVAVLVSGGISSVILSASFHAGRPQAETLVAAGQESASNDNPNGITLETIMTTLERQREQVKSLTIETVGYATNHVPPHVLNSLQRFRGGYLTDQQEQFHESIFAYKEGKRYLRMLNTTVTKSEDAEVTDVTYNSERASDGVGVWERRVDLKRGPAQVFVLPVNSGQQWTSNPVYCMNFGWDCRTELHTRDEAVLDAHRKHDFLSLLKKGAFTLDAQATTLQGVKCAVLRRDYEIELVEYDPAKNENVTFNDEARETVWLDVGRGYAMLQSEVQTRRWGLDRTVNSEFVEILPGLWFPKKTERQPHAPPDAPQEYQGRPLLSWHQDMIRWSVNDVPDGRFDIITMPGDHLIEHGKPIRVIGEDGRPIDQTDEIPKLKVSTTHEKSDPTPAPNALTTEEEQFVSLLAKAAATAHPNTATLRVAIAKGDRCNPAGTFIELLGSHPGCQCESIPLVDMDEEALQSFDVLLIPGGHAESQAKQLRESGRHAIREFVEAGGGYVGICAGAKLATANFDWSLKLINARTLSDKRQSPGPDGVMTVDMGKRGSGDVKMELTDAGRRILGGPTGLIETAFRLSPVLLPTNHPELPRCISLGDYRSEVWLHNLQIGTMVDTSSILAARYGNGRVIVFSSHPEGRVETKTMLVHAVLATARDTDRPD